MAGAVAKKLLSKVGIEVIAHTIQISSIHAAQTAVEDIKYKAEQSPLRCADAEATKEMIEAIEQARQAG